MRKIGYSGVMKAVAVFLQHLTAAILVICVVLLSVLMDRSMLDYRDLRNTNFWESSYFTNMFCDTMDEILDFKEYQKRFETDGVYNPQKVVNTVAYYAQKNGQSQRPTVNSGENTLYYLQVLDDWSRNYTKLNCSVESTISLEEGEIIQRQRMIVDGEKVWEYTFSVQSLEQLELSLQQKIIDEVQSKYGGNYKIEAYSDYKSYSNSSQVIQQKDLFEQPQDDAALLNGIIERIQHGELFELDPVELRNVLADLDLYEISSVTEKTIIAEEYETLEGKTILKEFLNGNITLMEMFASYESLEYTLDSIGEEITTYKRLVNKYENGNSNVTYWIYDQMQDQVYSNISEAKLDAGRDLEGRYFYYNKTDIVADTNVTGMVDTYYERFEERNYGANGVIYLSVDHHLPYEDDYYQAKSDYQALKPWALASIIIGIICGIVNFLCFAYLSLAAGHQPQDDEIHLGLIDRIKTEILLVTFFLIFMILPGIIQRMLSIYSRSDMFSNMLMGCVLTVVLLAVIMICYLSLLRRMKAHVMWSGSFTYWFMHGVQKLIQNWHPSAKIIFYFGMHLVFTLGMMFLLLIRRNWWLPILVIYLIFSIFEVIFLLREGVQRNHILKGIKRITEGDVDYKICLDDLKNDNKIMGEAINNIGEGLFKAVEDRAKDEKMKADLITNVSHDIKTPLTSIINYVDLLKREDLQNERAKSYIQILDSKSQRLKQLTEDLVEASKLSSGNIELVMEPLNFVELVYQMGGEFIEKFEEKGLEAVTRLPKQEVMILADGRRIWRVLENLYNNIAKYALEGSRVYVDMNVVEEDAVFTIKNISRQALNIKASELTERFIRGDVSRSTEGSGLGLSIAQNLTTLMGGCFEIYLDGDLFKVTITFPMIK